MTTEQSSRFSASELIEQHIKRCVGLALRFFHEKEAPTTEQMERLFEALARGEEDDLERLLK